MSLVAILMSPSSALSEVPDTVNAPVVHLEEMVVVGDRTGSLLRESVAATSLLTREDIDALPGETLPEIIRSIPGIVLVDRDGSGRIPMAVARGFFGGGETSYVLLMKDGVPLNSDRTGLVEWMEIPLAEVQRVEILRGSASVMYGDAAVGAVVNVVTRDTDSRSGQTVGFWTGSSGARGLQGGVARPWASGWLRVSGVLDEDDGFRSHSRSERSYGSVAYHRSSPDGGEAGFARFSVSRLRNQEPGPLDPGSIGENRESSLSLFAGDERDRTAVDLSGMGSRLLDGGTRADASFRLRRTGVDWTRTLLLAPSFGNTQRLQERTVSAWGRVQMSLPLGRAQVRVGAEGEAAGFETRYRDPSDNQVLGRGEGRRLDLATHGEVVYPLVDGVTLHAGLRYDRVRPRDTGADGTAATFHQWSPRVALNLGYAQNSSARGNLFLSWSRSFKSPTLDQLFDVREIPTGQPGQGVSFSNPDLKPQRSSAVELGVYQRISLGVPWRFAEVSATAYQQWLDDEIDFDLRTFKYGNILRSRHTGLEGSVRVALFPGVQISHAATLTRAIFRSPNLDGNQLKNIPRTALVTSAWLDLPAGLTLSATHRVTGSVFLDDENTTKLDGSSIVDSALGWKKGPLGIRLSMANVFDSSFNAFGYLLYDPGMDTQVQMTHPGAGRRVTLSLTLW